MKKFIFLLAILLSNVGISNAVEGTIAQNEIRAFFDDLVLKFNNQDVEGYEAIFMIPHARHIAEQVTLVGDKSTSLVNFDQLRKLGWEKSVLKKLHIFYSSRTKVFVNVEWTRMGTNDEILQDFTAFYALTKFEDRLKITYISATDTTLTIGMDES